MSDFNYSLNLGSDRLNFEFHPEFPYNNDLSTSIWSGSDYYSMLNFDIGIMQLMQNAMPLMSPFDFSLFSNLSTFMNGSDFTSTSNNMNSNYTISGDNIIPYGYNKEKGEKLSNIAWNRRVGFTSHCATYVKKAIEKAGLGKYESANAWDCYRLLDKNPNFKEIPVPNDYKKLPAGCILLFKPNSQGYHPKYGHIEMSLGNGKAVSDGVTNNMKKPDKVYIPV